MNRFNRLVAKQEGKLANSANIPHRQLGRSLGTSSLLPLTQLTPSWERQQSVAWVLQSRGTAPLLIREIQGLVPRMSELGPETEQVLLKMLQLWEADPSFCWEIWQVTPGIRYQDPVLHYQMPSLTLLETPPSQPGTCSDMALTRGW